MSGMASLKSELKRIVVEELNLVHVRPEEIGDDDPLFGDRFGLDSIDAVELVFQLKKHFGVVIKNQSDGRSILQSINTICTFIESRQGA